MTRATRRLGEIRRKRGEFEDALTLLHESLQHAVEQDDLEGQILTRKSLANTYKHMSRLDEALDFFKKGLEGSRMLSHKKLEAEHLNDIATLLIERHELTEAKDRLEEAAEIIRGEPAFRAILVSVILNLGVVAYFQKNIQWAIDRFREAAKIAEQIGDVMNTMIARHNIGEMLIEFGEFEQAYQEFETCLHLAENVGNETERINNAMLVGFTKTKLGKYDEGVLQLSEVIAECEKRGYWNFFCEASIYLGRAHWARKDRAQAEAAFHRALKRAFELKNPSLIQRTQEEIEKLNQTSGKNVEGIA